MLLKLPKLLSLTFLFLLFTILNVNPAGAQNAKFGVNVGPLHYWTSEGMYIDILKHAPPWKGYKNASVAIDSVTTDINGCPLTDASTSFHTFGYPSGKYSFIMNGKGTPSFSSLAQIVPGTLHTAVSNGITTTTCQVNVISPQPRLGAFNGLSGAVVFALTGVNANDPPRNMHLTIPGYPADTTQIFNPQFLQALSPFCCLRMMDMMRTNNSPITTWETRIRPTAWGQDGGSSYENIIAMANAANTDIWINVPYLATDDWAVGMARLLKANLNPNLNIYLEYSNECWNWAFRANYLHIEAQALSNSALPVADTGAKRHGDQVAYNLMHFTNIFKQTLGDSANRLRPVLCGQFGNPIYLSAGLAFIKQAYGEPKHLIYGIAGAPYLWPARGTSVNSLDDVFISLNDRLNARIVPAMQQNIALANSYGLPYMGYECGQSLVPANGDEAQFNLFLQAQLDPRMQAILEKLARIWDTGGGLCNFYNLCSIWNKWGYWGALTDVRQVNNPTLRYTTEASIAKNHNQNHELLPPPKKVDSGRKKIAAR